MYRENKVQVQYVSYKQKKSAGSLTHSSKHLWLVCNAPLPEEVLEVGTIE